MLRRLNADGALVLVDGDDPSLDLFLGERLLPLALLNLPLAQASRALLSLALLSLALLLHVLLALRLRILLRLRLRQAGCRNERACRHQPEQCRLVHRRFSWM